MQYKILEAEYSGEKFKIEKDNPRVGAYLYIYKNEKCIRDFLRKMLLLARRALMNAELH
jgi:hypothetical protein